MPDAVLPEGIDFCHRHGIDKDIYFLANLTGSTIKFKPKFRAKRTYTYLYDALTDRYISMDDSLTLHSHHSIFVILTDETDVPLESDSYTLKYAQPIENKWNIIFEETNRHIADTSLFDWSQQEENDIKYYSGHVTYETTYVENPKEPTKNSKDRIVLEIGKNLSRCYNMKMYVNGIDK